MREPETPAASSWMDEEEQRRGLSPTRVFVVLLIVVALLVGIGLLATSNNDPVADDQPLPSTNNFALTDDQAIARFKELDQISEGAYAARDESLVTQYTTSDSPLRPSGYEDIRQLQKDDIEFRPRSKTLSVVVLRNDPEEIAIQQIVVQRPIFRTESGKDVSENHGPVRLTIEWILRREGSSWRLFDSTLVKRSRV